MDDATVAAFRAVMLAREHGHAVSWFVNGRNVELQEAYFPFQLSLLIDTCSLHACSFRNKVWMLETLQERRRFRKFLKDLYMAMSCHEEIEALVDEVRVVLGLGTLPVDEELSTATVDHIAIAIAAGVDVSNHAWDHLNPLRSCCEEVSSVLANEMWLSQFRAPDFQVYAPPFGQYRSFCDVQADTTIFADRSHPTGHPVEGNLCNRSDLADSMADDVRPDGTHVCLQMSVEVANV